MLVSLFVCSVFDLSPHMLGTQSQIILRISYFATVEKWAGRGFAKLLLTFLKVQAGEKRGEVRRRKQSGVRPNRCSQS